MYNCGRCALNGGVCSDHLAQFINEAEAEKELLVQRLDDKNEQQFHVEQMQQLDINQPQDHPMGMNEESNGDSFPPWQLTPFPSSSFVVPLPNPQASRVPPRNLSPSESHIGRPLQRYTQESGRNFQQQYDYRQSSRPGSLMPFDQTTAVNVPVSSIEIRCGYAFIYCNNNLAISQVNIDELETIIQTNVAADSFEVRSRDEGTVQQVYLPHHFWQRFLQNCRQLKITGEVTGNFVHQLVKALPQEAEVFSLIPSNLIEYRCCKLFRWIPRGIKTLRIDSTKLNEHNFYGIVSSLTTFAQDGQLERFEIFTNKLPDGALLVSLLERLNSVSGCSGIIFESRPADDHVIRFLLSSGYHSSGQAAVNGQNYHKFSKEKITIGLVVAASSVGPHGLNNRFAVQIPFSGFERRTGVNFNTVGGSRDYPIRSFPGRRANVEGVDPAVGFYGSTGFPARFPFASRANVRGVDSAVNFRDVAGFYNYSGRSFPVSRRRANVVRADSAVGFGGSTDFATRPPFASRANVEGVNLGVNSRDVAGSNNYARFSAFRNRTNVEVVNLAVTSHDANNLRAGPAFSVVTESNTVLKEDDTGSVAVPTEPKYTTGGSGVYTDDEADDE
uniref:Uncharacterized protein n=1 Tax=Panagrolaimus sp. JU765 TaxID=591449 RepID=A0AC34RCB2_9BILA